MTTNAVFPAILVFFKGVLLSVIQKRVFCNSRYVLLLLFPQSPFFKNTLGLSFSRVFYLSFVFPFNIPCFFHQPLWDDIIVLFHWLYCCCFICASFFPTSFLISPSQIHLAFIFGRLALIFFIFEWYCFQVWCFLLCYSCWFLFGFLLIVVVTFLFITGICLFCCFLLSFCGVKFLWRLLFWFQIMT